MRSNIINQFNHYLIQWVISRKFQLFFIGSARACAPTSDFFRILSGAGASSTIFSHYISIIIDFSKIDELMALGSETGRCGAVKRSPRCRHRRNRRRPSRNLAKNWRSVGKMDQHGWNLMKILGEFLLRPLNTHAIYPWNIWTNYSV